MQNHIAMTLFIHLLLSATHQEYKAGVPNGGFVILKRGQWLTGRKRLATEIGASEQQVRTALALLVGLEIITIRPTKRFSLITIVKYEDYQTISSEATNRVTTQQPPDNHLITTKQEEENKRTKEVRDQFDLFWVKYPRRVGKAKALVAWNNMTSKERSGALGAIDSHIALWEKEERKTPFIPHPTSWLHAQSWDDEIEKMITMKSPWGT